MIHPVTRFPSYRFDIFKKNQYKITLSWVIRPSEDFPHFDEKTIIKKMYNIKCFQFTSAVVEDACKWQSHNKYLQMCHKIPSKILKVWTGWVKV